MLYRNPEPPRQKVVEVHLLVRESKSSKKLFSLCKQNNERYIHEK